MAIFNSYVKLPEAKIDGFLSAMLNMLQWNGHLPLSSLEASTHHRVVCDHIGDLVATVRGQLVVPGRASWTSDVLAFLVLPLIVFRTSPSFLVHVWWSYISYHIISYHTISLNLLAELVPVLPCGACWICFNQNKLHRPFWVRSVSVWVATIVRWIPRNTRNKVKTLPNSKPTYPPVI